MIDLTKLTESEKAVLRKMVLYTCESCFRDEEEAGTLQVHRIKRNTHGGIYHLRNIKLLCSRCHLKYHQNENSHVRSSK